MCATESAPSYRPCPSPSASRLAASPSPRAHGSNPAASLSVVRQALEKALLQDNEDFWAANPPDPNAMDQQDPFRRDKLAMQFFLRLHILVACKGVAISPPPLGALTHSRKKFVSCPSLQKSYSFKCRSCTGVTCIQSKSCSQCNIVTALPSSEHTVRNVLVWPMHAL